VTETGDHCSSCLECLFSACSFPVPLPAACLLGRLPRRTRRLTGDRLSMVSPLWLMGLFWSCSFPVPPPAPGQLEVGEQGARLLHCSTMPGGPAMDGGAAAR
jgi:hypothetical protein